MAFIKRAIAVLYGLFCYLAGVTSLLLIILFANNHFTILGIDALNSLAIDSWNSRPSEYPLIVNITLLAIFALQHSVMARKRFKRVVTKLIPERLERSTYVLATSITLLMIVQYWQPMPEVIWKIEEPISRTLINLIYYVGWIISLFATHMINHYHLMGLEQSMTTWEDAGTKKFVTPMFYKFVRHPIQSGILIALLATPDMTIGRAVFAAGMSLYIFIGLWFEERDLIDEFGDTYKDYKSRVSALFPLKF
ncbi:isoprenylcysteine carboxylmethyltransferase family protein [Kordiimonas sp. SCSIO 12610]|uniref:methyltransferase family protein n=1 Tax=Kordiimonas sp. SCSIO 12610 TaxID=2829597 RepID=UPI00210B9082|nr:NnrU family protein [Kordiimonas sp. SCSIO 12610]UTW56038.1 isoprenylcysteine carboxylmethyltransferase family protein [Kordiimonas sp. SCSIO 12610]